MTGPGPRVPNQAATVVAFHRPLSDSDEALVLSYEPPWSCVVEVLPAGGEKARMDSLLKSASPDPTLLLQEISEGAPGANDLCRRLRKRRPEAEILAFEPRSVLKFLWCFRDAHDPMTLAHASDRTLFDETWHFREAPILRAGRRAARRTAVEEVRSLLHRMGGALGVELPFPRGDREESSWGLSRLSGLIEAGLGLYAGLLHRWGSPLATVRNRPDGPPLLALEDRWLRENRNR